MSRHLHVCLYNADPASSGELQGHLRELNFVRLGEEVGEPDDLASVLQASEIDLVFFHLDPDAAPILEVIDQVSTRYPNIALIAMSERVSPVEILAPMRLGCDQFVCKPIDQADLANAVARVANKRLLSRTQGRCICVTNASGGAGATSIACNLALEIGQVTDTECALVDLNLQFGDTALNFDCEPKYSLFDLADAGDQADRSILDSTLIKLPCKVCLLARPQMIEQCEAITPEVIHRVLELLTANFETVVVDVPRRVDAGTSAAFRHADLILIVCQLVVPSVRNAKRFFDALVRCDVAEDRIEIVINRGDSSSSRITIDDVREMIGKPVYATIPNDYAFVARSLDLGRPAAALDLKNPVRSAIRKIATRITVDPTPDVETKQSKRGLLSRLFR